MAKHAPVTRLELIDLVKKVDDLGDIDTSAIKGAKFTLNGIKTIDKMVKTCYNSLVIKIYKELQMENLREILEKKTREELAHLIGLAFYQRKKRLGEWYADKSHIKEIADKALKGKLYRAKTKTEMVENVLGSIYSGDLRPEQI